MFTGFKIGVAPIIDEREEMYGHIFMIPLTLLGYGIRQEMKNREPKNIDYEEVYSKLFLSFLNIAQKEFKILDIDEYEL